MLILTDLPCRRKNLDSRGKNLVAGAERRLADSYDPGNRMRDVLIWAYGKPITMAWEGEKEVDGFVAGSLLIGRRQTIPVIPGGAKVSYLPNISSSLLHRISVVPEGSEEALHFQRGSRLIYAARATYVVHKEDVAKARKALREFEAQLASILENMSRQGIPSFSGKRDGSYPRSMLETGSGDGFGGSFAKIYCPEEIAFKAQSSGLRLAEALVD